MSIDHAPLLLEPSHEPDDPPVAPPRSEPVADTWFREPQSTGRVAEFFGRATFLFGLCVVAALVVVIGWTIIFARAMPFTSSTAAGPESTLGTTYTESGGSGPVIVDDGVVLCTAELLPDHTAVTGSLRCDWAGFARGFPGTLDYTFAQSAHLGYTVSDGKYAVVATTPDGQRLASVSDIAAS